LLFKVVALPISGILRSMLEGPLDADLLATIRVDVL
jgi:hypothetical protein